MTSQIMIHRDEANHRFYALVDNKECILEYKELDPNTYEYFHTLVPEDLRHHGIAAKLAEYALDWAHQNHKKVVASCSYVMNYIAKNKRFRDLVS